MIDIYIDDDISYCIANYRGSKNFDTVLIYSRRRIGYGVSSSRSNKVGAADINLIYENLFVKFHDDNFQPARYLNI